MPGYGFSQTRIFPYKDRIVDSVVIRENTGQRKPRFWHMLRGDGVTDYQKKSVEKIS